MARQSMMGKIALGATGLALTTGAVMAAVMLARNKRVRETVKKGAEGALKGAREVLKENGSYQAISHRISAVGKRKNKRGRK